MSNDKLAATFGRGTKIGFTGTRDGMSIKQLSTFELLVRRELQRPGSHEWHDGDCVGADEQAHRLVAKLKKDWAIVQIHSHPCNLKTYRAHLDQDILHPIYPPMVRNRHIVLESDIMICAPLEYEEQVRGGTWGTIKYARRLERPRYIIWPDGQWTDDKQESTLLDV